MWFPEEVWRHIQSFATYRKYYLLYPPRNDLHANLFRVLDGTMKVRLHAFLNDESRAIVVCLDEMVQYMLDDFDKLILVTLRDWEGWRNFTLLMIIRTATYQTEAESRMDFCLACDDRSCVRCCRLTRLKANSVMLRARYDEWIKSM